MLLFGIPMLTSAAPSALKPPTFPGVKKADVTEHSQVFNHVGLLKKWPLMFELPFLWSSDDLSFIHLTFQSLVAD